MKILILCTGNIGRSPLAEVMLRHALADGLGTADAELAAAGVVVTSAGTAAAVDHIASRRGITVAEGLGLDLTGHRARQVTAAELRAADLVLVMDDSHVAAVRHLAPEVHPELIAGEEIPDPHWEDDAFFQRVADQIEAAVEVRSSQILQDLANG